MTKRFRGLRAVAIVFKVLAAVAALGAIVGLVVAVLAPSLMGSVWPAARIHPGGDPGLKAFPALVFAPVLVGAALSVTGVIHGLFLCAAGQGIDLLLALEENARQVAQALSRAAAATEAAAQHGT
jgi:hypothetical protein